MSVLRRVKLRTPDGIESIEYPLGVDAENVEVANGENLSQRLARIDEDLEKNEEDIAAVSELAGRNKQNIGAAEVRIDALERRNASIDKKLYYFNTIADMKAANLQAGDACQTLGYYSANDGGAGLYKITDDNTLVDDGGSIHTLENSLRAELIVESNIIPNLFGAFADNDNDDSTAILKCINYAINNNLNVKSFKNYTIKNPLIIDLKSSHINIELNFTPQLNSEQTGLTFTNGVENNISIFVNRGTALNGVSINKMFHANLNISGYYFNGCLLRVTGNDQDYTHNLGMKINLRNFNCKQTLNHQDNVSSSGFGEYNFVWEETWDNLNAIGSIISNSYDVTINHWESHFVTNVENQINLTLQACKSCKINYLALGGKCSHLLKINTGSEIYADEIHLGSEDGANVDGILLINSNLYVTDLKLVSVGTGVNLQDLTSLIKADNIVPSNVENIIIRNNYNFNFPNKQMSFTNIETYPLNRLEVKHISPTVNITNGTGTINIDISQYNWDILLGANVIPYGTSNGFTLGISSDSNGNYTLGIKCLNTGYNNSALQLRIILFGYKQLN